MSLVDSYGKIISGIQLIPHACRGVRTLHALRLVKGVILDHVIWWSCALVKFGELYEFSDLGIMSLGDICDWWIMWIVWRCVHVDVCYFLWCLYTWWFYLMIIILVIIMKCEPYVFDLVMMISLLILLKWWIVFVELIRQEFMWSIWLFWIRWIICIMWNMCFM